MRAQGSVHGSQQLRQRCLKLIVHARGQRLRRHASAPPRRPPLRLPLLCPKVNPQVLKGLQQALLAVPLEDGFQERLRAHVILSLVRVLRLRGL